MQVSGDIPATDRAYWELYSGKREVLGIALISHDPYDKFGWVQEWRFAICDRLTWDLGETVPKFRSYGPDEESFALYDLRENDTQPEALWYALKVLTRYREWLRIAGVDY